MVNDIGYMVLVILKRMKDNNRKSAAYDMNNNDQLPPPLGITTKHLSTN